MVCPNCNSKTESVKSYIQKSEIITRCSNCTDNSLQVGNGTNAQYYRREQQTKFRKELTQPVEPREFIKAYGEDAARKRGFTDETIRKYSL